MVDDFVVVLPSAAGKCHGLGKDLKIIWEMRLAQ